MSRQVIKFSETLMLRRIDTVDILKRYLNKEYEKLTIPEDKVKVVSSINMAKSMGYNPTEKNYRLKDKSITGKVVVTTNHDNYQYVRDLNTKTPTNQKAYRCLHCKRIIKGSSVGIPLEMSMNRQNKNITFYTEGTYCHFGCAYADLKRQLRVQKKYIDPLYMDAESMLYTMYYKMYPKNAGKKIRSSPDWRLLDENNGPLTSEQFDEEKYEYVQVPTLVILPAKRQYIRIVKSK